jgi:hypothetical protein
MTDLAKIRVFEIVGSALCVASDDGQKVYEQIAAALKNGRRVAVSFQNIESLTSAFLNAAIGQLYGQFTDEQIRQGLTVSDMEQDDLFLLKRVVDTAKSYFKDRGSFEKARDKELEDAGDDQ